MGIIYRNGIPYGAMPTLSSGENINITQSNHTITISATDTNNKTTSSNSTSKLFLVGATTQSTSGQTTYSNSSVYTTNGKLYTAGLENAGQMHSDYSMYVGAYVDTNERGVYLGTAESHDRIVSLQRTNTGGGILRIGQFGSSSSIILHAPNITFGSDSDTSPSSSQLTVDGDYLTITKRTCVTGNILTTGNIIARNENTATEDGNNYGLRVFDGVDNLNLVMFRRTTASTPNSRFTFANVVPSTNASLSTPQNQVFIGNDSTTEYRFPGIIQSAYGTGSGTTLVVNTSTGKIMRTSSTRRVKTNINYITPQEKERYHNMVMQLKPTTFELINEPGKTDLGLIAEDVYDVCHIAALEEERAIYDITEEEAKALDRDREIIGTEKTGEIENYKDRAILAMLIADNQYKDSQIESLKEQVANLSELINSLIEKQDSNSSLWK